MNVSSDPPTSVPPGRGQSCSTLCGDGVTAGDEVCDTSDGCSHACEALDGFKCATSYQSGSQHQSFCEAICGDGLRLGTEECDDGGLINDDGNWLLCVQCWFFKSKPRFLQSDHMKCIIRL